MDGFCYQTNCSVGFVSGQWRILNEQVLLLINNVWQKSPMEKRSRLFHLPFPQNPLYLIVACELVAMPIRSNSFHRHFLRVL